MKQEATNTQTAISPVDESARKNPLTCHIFSMNAQRGHTHWQPPLHPCHCVCLWLVVAGLSTFVTLLTFSEKQTWVWLGRVWVLQSWSELYGWMWALGPPAFSPTCRFDTFLIFPLLILVSPPNAFHVLSPGKEPSAHEDPENVAFLEYHCTVLTCCKMKKVYYFHWFLFGNSGQEFKPMLGKSHTLLSIESQEKYI